MMKFGITPTLLNSFDWYSKCPETWRAKALDDIKKTLRREPFVAGPEAKKGIELESAVQKTCSSELLMKNCQASKNYIDLCGHCYGGLFQKWVEYFFPNPIGESLPSVRAYGKVDVWFPHKIIDIKSTSRWKGEQNYTNGWQHVVYCLATGINKFEYLVAVWEDATSLRIKELHVVRYTLKPTDEKRLIAHYGRFIEFLKRNELYEDYLTLYMKNKIQ